jgi:hypothetical protein
MHVIASPEVNLISSIENGRAILSKAKHPVGILPAAQFLTRDYSAVEQV